MMRFSAPGKLVLAGEYAVVEGRPALVAAVEPRATCARAPSEALWVSAMGTGPLSASLEGGRVRFAQDHEGRLELVVAVLEAAQRAGISLPRAGFVLDSAAFSRPLRDGHPQKLGLGSSAAVAVALAAALVGEVTRAGLYAIWRIADEGHRRFSEGRGSGIDVAIATFGGVARFEKSADDPTPLVSPWGLCPRGITTVAAYAGYSVSTREYLGQVAAFAARERSAYVACIDAIERATEELLAAARPEEHAEVFLAAIQRCQGAMRRLGDQARVDIVSAPHRHIARLAFEAGGAAKPSGAGGGDVAIAFVPEARRNELCAALEEAGYPVVDVPVGVEGVRLDANPESGI